MTQCKSQRVINPSDKSQPNHNNKNRYVQQNSARFNEAAASYHDTNSQPALKSQRHKIMTNNFLNG